MSLFHRGQHADRLAIEAPVRRDITHPFTRSEITLLKNPPRPRHDLTTPSPPPALPAPVQAAPGTRQVQKTLVLLEAEVGYLGDRGRLCQLDEADTARREKRRLPRRHPTRVLVRKAATMVWDCPPKWEPGPVPASLPALLSATMGSEW